MNKKFCKAQIKMNYQEAEFLKECLAKYYKVFAGTLDTEDYVPEEYNKKIRKYVFTRMKKAIRRACAGNREFQRELLKKERAKWRAALKKANGVNDQPEAVEKPKEQGKNE